MKICCDKSNPPLGGALLAEFHKLNSKEIQLTWGSENSVLLPNSSKPLIYVTSNDLIRILERTSSGFKDPLQNATLNHWLTFSLSLESDMPSSLEYLDRTLAPITYLVGESLTASDLAVFSVLKVSAKYAEICKAKPPKNVMRWMKLVHSHPAVAAALKQVPAEALAASSTTRNATRRSPAANGDVPTGPKQEGKYVDLPHAEMGKVVVRFPPEASGYLHIGHAKAALLNQYYQEAFQGKLVMRFDDTNPAKENVHFEKVILEDVEMLEIKPDMFTHTSQYFELMLQLCEKLIRAGKAFVDDTPPDVMKTEREQKIESRNRDNSVEQNLKIWEEMKGGSETGVRYCVRAKIDMASPNGCMRDPTIYRCKPEPHPRTGTQYKVYPTYDFACPIVDSVEGVTHVLRTMEYHDRDPQFYWFIDALQLRKPYIWEYSRLSMTNTVLSKRKLTWFVEQGLVDGWDDPRMPTVRGVLRRGMTVEALRQFIRAQGSSRSVVFMEWDKIWAINKKVIDPIAPRYTALESDPVEVTLKGISCEEALTVPLHPKNPSVGTKTVLVGPTLLIDQADAKTLKEGENTTFINYGNVMIDKIHRSADGTVTKVEGTPNLENKDYKKTLKLTWLTKGSAPLQPVYCVYFDHIISKPLLGKDEDFKQYIGHQTRWEVAMVGEAALARVKAGDIVQLQRRGFYRVDVAPAPPSPRTSRAPPLVLLHVPDGHTKEQPGQGKPPVTKQVETKASPAGDAETLGQQIASQGDLVRTLKTSKTDKAKVDQEVKKLLDLKAQYKATTGQEWKPGVSPAPAAPQPAPAAGGGGELGPQVASQGELVRSLKASKADKARVDQEVKTLLELKAKYKAATGQDWKPGSSPAPAGQQAPAAGGDAVTLGQQIASQGDLVRTLKTSKADKVKVDQEVKTLLELKAQYKAATGQEWKPGVSPAPAAPQPAPAAGSAAELGQQVASQGELVRSLKASKADKAKIDQEVKTLLELKAKYKVATGQDWKPGSTAPVSSSAAPAASTPASDVASQLADRISAQGDKVRALKGQKAYKATVDAEVKNLLDLKAEYKQATGKEWTAPATVDRKKEDKKKEEKKKDDKKKDEKKKDDKKKEKPKEQQASKEDGKESGAKKVTRLGLEAKKETDLPEWYSQVITKGEMIEYYDISGCYILRPWSFRIWETIRDFLNEQFKLLGVKDCYFPIFVSKAALEREKTHIADFAPEVAWVTHSGESALAEHIAVRPTSETVMYPAYAKWVQSHRDLPIRLNQWNNVVRWEFKQPQPFIRTREFLWQEGHTAFLTRAEADEEVLQILDLYARVYEELLAIPVVKGRKTEKEKFAGSDYTTTVEAYVPASGRGIQGATSHHLGQNFSKMFDIGYEDPETQQRKHVFQNSWGITTRTIGVMVLVHGDDRGLVLPPRVAALQCVVVPCGVTAASSPAERLSLTQHCEQVVAELAAAGIRVDGDYRDNYSPGWKFNHWELKGVPVRVEVGPKDVALGQVVAVRRLGGERLTLPRAAAALPAALLRLLDDTHALMLDRARAERESRTTLTDSWQELLAALDRRHLILAPFCGAVACEDNIKADSAKTEEEASGGPLMGAKSLCIPFEQPRPLAAGARCVHPACSAPAQHYTLFGRSY